MEGIPGVLGIIDTDRVSDDLVLEGVDGEDATLQRLGLRDDVDIDGVEDFLGDVSIGDLEGKGGIVSGWCEGGERGGDVT